ncbi:DedA family protein [Aeromicrobium terrae]|uniref:DedA family protein n=1 Tax=Aeromicrobium terrae TaxID=2498846 RepID=A0A5C8NEG0_9ACTN|nr:DedA family protein [Aeromicrobium terrae]
MAVTILADLAAETSAVPTDGLTGLVADLMGDLGLFGAGLVLAVETFFPFLPSEVALPLAGFTASIPGNFGLVAVIVATTIGSVVGALALYAFSRAFGRDRTRALLLKAPLVTARDIDKGEAWFARNASAAVFFGRMVPAVRSLVSVPAGVEAMGVARFTLWTAAGSLIWNTIWIVAGYQLGSNWEKVEEYANILKYLLVVVVVAAVAWFVWTHLKARRAA